MADRDPDYRYDEENDENIEQHISDDDDVDYAEDLHLGIGEVNKVDFIDETISPEQSEPLKTKKKSNSVASTLSSWESVSSVLSKQLAVSEFKASYDAHTSCKKWPLDNKIAYFLLNIVLILESWLSTKD